MYNFNIHKLIIQWETKSQMKIYLWNNLFQRLSLKEDITGSIYFLSNINPFMKCTRNIWHLSGLQNKQTYKEILLTGKNSIPMKSISLNMFQRSLLPVMELLQKIWQNNFAQKCKFLKQNASMDFKSPWRIFIQKRTPFLSILILRIKMRNNFYLVPSPTLKQSSKKENGQ